MGAERKAEMKRAFKEKMKSQAKERKQHLQEKRAKLIVKNLPFAVTEEKLKSHFETFGKVTNVQLLKKEDGKLIGCGFVQFEAVQKAAKARFHLNGKAFLGRALECEFAMSKQQFEKKSRQEKRQKFYDEQKIKEEPIDTDVKVEFKEEPASDEIKTEEDSDGDEEQEDDSDKDDESIDSEDDEVVSDSDDEEEIKSEPLEKKPRFESHDVNEGKTIFVKNLPFEATKQDLWECMLQFGPVYYALVCIDKLTEHSKGTGFVKFKNKEDADKCLQAGTELSLLGTILDCHLAIGRQQIESIAKEKENAKERDSRNLYLVKEGVILAGTKAAAGVSASDMAKRLQLEQYKSQILRNLNMFISKTRLIVHNLPTSWDDKKLRVLLKKHAGPGAIIKESRVMRNMKSVDSKGKGLSKEYGFVTFTTHEHAINALRSLNNNPHIFSEAKRPIVAFSIENRVMVNTKQKRLEKSRQFNPLAQQYDPILKKEQQEKRKQKEQQQQQQQQQQLEDVPARTNQEKRKRRQNAMDQRGNKKTVEIIDGDRFSGTKGKPGVVQKMRSKFKLQTQAQTHNEQLKVEKRHRKNAKSIQQRQDNLIRQDAQKMKPSREFMDDNFSQMVNDYKSKLLKGNNSSSNSSSKLQNRGKWTDG